MSKRKIVSVGPAHPLRGGIADFNERLSKAFIEDGDNVKIITFSLQYPNFLFPGKTQYSNSEKPKDLDIEVCLNSINPLNWIRTANKIKKINPDLLIIQYWIPLMAPALGTLARIVKRNKFTKIIGVLHNINPHEKRFGDNILNKYFIKSADGFITMSKAVLKDLDDFDRNKPRVYNPHPIYDNFGSGISKNQALEELNLDKNYRYILFFGFIRDYKGLDLLLEAMADSRIYDSNIKLIVAGEFYNNPEKYYQIIENHNLKDKIVLKTDYIADNEVGKYFSAADIIVQPYKTATQSGVTQIAYHFEKPMIVTNVGGLSEIVPDGKVGFISEVNPKSVADCITKFYSDDIERFSANIAEEKKKYSWERLIEVSNRMIEEI
jgi:glycosyltransferase involved in cell wall biosynthesis